MVALMLSQESIERSFAQVVGMSAALKERMRPPQYRPRTKSRGRWIGFVVIGSALIRAARFQSKREARAWTSQYLPGDIPHVRRFVRRFHKQQWARRSPWQDGMEMASAAIATAHWMIGKAPINPWLDQTPTPSP